jgi:hypothetical protein
MQGSSLAHQHFEAASSAVMLLDLTEAERLALWDLLMQTIETRPLTAFAPGPEAQG